MRNLILFILTFCISSSFAKKWDAVYISNLISKGEIDKVINFYEERYNSSNRDPLDAFKIADLYVKKKDYTSAINWYDKEKQLMKSTKVNLLNYANTYRLNGQYQNALDAYLLYAAETGDASKVMENAYQCEKLIRATALQNTYKLENYPYNTDQDEINITFLRNNLVYTTKETSVKKKKSTTKYNLKQAIRQFESFTEPINTFNKNLSEYIITSVSYSRDGNKVAFSALNANPTNKMNANNESIYIADNLGGKWLNVQVVPFLTNGYSFKNPSLNSDGTTIYFSSNQTGGNGGFDIWQTTLENNKWNKPKNLGKLINSKSDETNPFTVQDNTGSILYFSSDKIGGFGGFDIYKAKNLDGIWQEVILQPSPINSEFDDNSIVYDPEIKTGYFSSDRKNGKGGFDIYRFLPFNLKLSVEIVEEESLNAVDFAYIQLQDKTIKLEEGISNEKGIASFFIGKDKEYTITVSKEGFINNTVKINSIGKTSGDSIQTLVKLIKDKSYYPSTSATSGTMSLQNYCFFAGKLLDAQTNKPAKAKMRMVNYNTSKIRDIDVDANGQFQLKLMLNNNYKIIIENGSYRINDELTTYGLENNQVKVKDYLLTGNKFKLLENKVYSADNLPTSLIDKLKIEQPIIKPIIKTTNNNSPSISYPKTFQYTTDRPTEYYKIQFGTFTDANIDLSEFISLGNIEKTTNASNQYIYRLGDFYTIDDAVVSLELARSKGYFVAFILQYNNEKIIKIIQ
jgi:hypothetical protein